MTTGSERHQSHHWRRRLRPAAPVLVWCSAAAPALLAVWALAIRGGPQPQDPAPARPLPAPALAGEQVAVFPQLRDLSAGPDHRLVDVVDTAAAAPRRIRIPAIGVSARVGPLRLGPGGRMQTPHDFAATGWYEPGREPGESGPAVIVGHVDSKSGPAVFYLLRRLRRGDVIRIVRADRTAVRFRVEGLERWPKSDFPSRKVFGDTRASTLRLITCSGNFDPSSGHYVDNTIVYAVRVRAHTR